MSGIPKQTSGVKTTSKETGQIYSKHLLALRDYWTPLKLWNLLHCELEKRRRTISTQAMPYVAVIDVTNTCNLRCPGCPSGAGVYGRPKTMLDLGRLARFLDETGRYLLLASLYNWGETLLHPQAPEIVKMVHERRIFTSISTNLNIRNLDRLNAICDAGLDYLIISADGATPESYRKYRVGGDFELVLSNIKHVAEYRRSKMRSRPILEWQVLTSTILRLNWSKSSHLRSGSVWIGSTPRGRPRPEPPAGIRSAARSLLRGCRSLWSAVAQRRSAGGRRDCAVLQPISSGR